MADNVGVDTGTGATVATDDVGGIQFQKIKIDVGGDGVSAPLSTANPLPVNDAGGSLTVDGTLASTQSGIWAVRLQDGSGNGVTSKAVASERPLSVAIVDGSGNQVTAFGGTGGTSMTDDAAFTPASTAITPVGGTYRSSRDTVDNNDGGAFAMTQSRAILASLETPNADSAMDDTLDAVKVSIVGDTVGSNTDGSGNAIVVGSVAHDAADANSPVKLGAKAIAALSGATLVAAADRTDLYAGVDGVLIMRPHCNLEDTVSGNASNTDGTSTACIAASGVGVKTYLTTIVITNMHASTDGYVEIKDGTSVKLTIPAPHASGAIINLPVPIGGTANTAWNFDPSAAISTIYCSMVGFKSKV